MLKRIDDVGGVVMKALHKCEVVGAVDLGHLLAFNPHVYEHMEA